MLTRYDQSPLWRLHDGWLRAMDVTAFSGGAIPHRATNSAPAARQKAAFVLSYVTALAQAGALPADAPVTVLEVGAGAGRFAARFLGALESDLGPAGNALWQRLTYYLSDLEPMICAAAERPELAGAIADGRLVPCVYDLRAPQSLTGLDGAPLSPQAVVTLASYVCCVSPHRFFRKTGYAWRELHVDVTHPGGRSQDDWLATPEQPGLLDELEVTESWDTVDLGEAFDSELHPHAIELAVISEDKASVAYPVGVLDFMAGASELVHPQGAFLVTDFGDPRERALAGHRARHVRHYGNSLNHGVRFSVLKAWALTTDRGWLCTDDASQSLHTAVIGVGPTFPPGIEERFASVVQDDQAWQQLLDGSHAARLYASRGEHIRAYRQLVRCLRLDPCDPTLHLRAGTAAIESGLYAKAVEHLDACVALDPDEQTDATFELGRAHSLQGDNARAIRWYRAALARRADATTWTNLGSVYEADGDADAAALAYGRALELDAGYTAARERLEALKARWWERRMKRVDAGPGLKWTGSR